MNASPSDKARAVIAVLDAVRESIEAAGSAGAPGGVLYAALMGQGCTLEQFNGIMRILVASGRVRKAGDLYFAEGRAGA